LKTLYSLDDELVDAVFLSDADDVRRLLGEGANPDARDDDDQPALMMATADGNRDLVRLLLEAGAETSLRDGDGWTALDVAVYRKTLDLVWLLLQYGAKTSAMDDTGSSVLLRALAANKDGTDLANPGGDPAPTVATPAAPPLGRDF
jgi:uncharacterized protein